MISKNHFLAFLPLFLEFNSRLGSCSPLSIALLDLVLPNWLGNLKVPQKRGYSKDSSVFFSGSQIPLDQLSNAGKLSTFQNFSQFKLVQSSHGFRSSTVFLAVKMTPYIIQVFYHESSMCPRFTHLLSNICSPEAWLVCSFPGSRLGLRYPCHLHLGVCSRDERKNPHRALFNIQMTNLTIPMGNKLLPFPIETQIYQKKT